MPSSIPQISVVIPLYNAERWIEATVESLRAQGGVGLEIVVIDDGSTDGGAAVAERALQALAVTYRLIAIPNGGPSRARNLGWRQARGEWVQFLDADDLLAPGKLALQLGHHAATLPETAVLYGPWQRFAQQAAGWQPVGPVLQPELGTVPLDGLLLTDNFIANGSALCRRSWLERVGGFDERYHLIEDVELMLRIAMAGGAFVATPSGEPIFFYRTTPQSLSQRDMGAFLEGCVRNAALLERHWRARDELTSARARYLAEVYLQGARYFAAANPARFEQLVSRIEALAPGFVPAGPPLLHALSRLLGYRLAERVAVRYRRAKAMLRP